MFTSFAISVASRTERRMGLLWFCFRNLILYGQKWVLFNKNESSLTKFVAYYKFKILSYKIIFQWKSYFRHDKIHFVHRPYFCYLIWKLAEKVNFVCKLV